jgi:hypothetical protein
MNPFSIVPPTALWALYWVLKSTFLGSWMLARWLAWLLSPVWITIAAVGAAVGFLSGR